MRNLIAVLGLITAAACGSGAQLSLSTRAGSAASTAPTALTKPATVTSSSLTLSNGITIDRLRVVVRKLELERASATPNDLADLQEFEAGPFLIDLSGQALSGSVQAQVTASVPSGAYREVKFEVHKPDTSEPGVSANTGLSAMAAAQASIIVDGTIDTTQQFSFVTSVTGEQKFEGSFQVDTGAQNVTLNIDVTGWFGGSGTARLNPNDPSMRSQIENNIQTSFKVFDDDNMDGHADHL
jgi:hypothetical protein